MDKLDVVCVEIGSRGHLSRADARRGLSPGKGRNGPNRERASHSLLRAMTTIGALSGRSLKSLPMCASGRSWSALPIPRQRSACSGPRTTTYRAARPVLRVRRSAAPMQFLTFLTLAPGFKRNVT